MSFFFIAKTKITHSFFFRKAYENLSKKFEHFKVECEKELYEQLNEQFQKCLSEKLDDVISMPHCFYYFIFLK